MAAVGDTQVRFTRSYIFLNPTPEGTAVGAGIGTWRLSVDDEYEGSGPQPPDTDGTTATGTVGAAAAADSADSAAAGAAW